VQRLPGDIACLATGEIGHGCADILALAHAVAFLAAEHSGYITGHVLSVNGGMYM